MKKNRKILKKSILIGGIVGLIVGLLPFLPMLDLILDLDMEFLEVSSILLVPPSLVSRNLLTILIISPIFYTFLGVLVGFIISKKRTNEN